MLRTIGGCSTSLVFSAGFHVVNLTIFIVAVYFRLVQVTYVLPENHRFRVKCGNWKYLTVWNALFQTFYFFWCCVTDLVLTSGSRSPIAKKFVAFRDWFLAAVAFPIGTMVVAIFWAIWAVDRELIFPKELDDFFPAWLNHVLHTTVLPILLVEMFLVQHKVPSRKAGFMGTLCVGLAYLSWILYLGYAMDIWVYPVLRVLSGVYFVLFLAVSAIFLLTLYIVGEKITSFFWRGYPDSDYEYTKID